VGKGGGDKKEQGKRQRGGAEPCTYRHGWIAQNRGPDLLVAGGRGGGGLPLSLPAVAGGRRRVRRRVKGGGGESMWSGTERKSRTGVDCGETALSLSR
jgi:glutamate-1-semialdehyde aminotransferase